MRGPVAQLGECYIRIVEVVGSTPIGSTKNHYGNSRDGFFILQGWESKDERYRATVRWTVVTASDQATAVARIDSHRVHQKPLRQQP